MANCSDVLVSRDETATVTPTGWARRACFSLERVLIVPAFDRQVDRHHSRTRRCRSGAGVRKWSRACVSFSASTHDEGAADRMSGTPMPAQPNSGSGSDSRPRQVMNVAVLAESELGSEAQRERRKRILDATLAIASKGGYEAVQMPAVAERADVAVGTLYRYFPSKVHLLVSALGREFERIDAKTDRASLTGGTPYQRLNIMVGKLNRAMQRNPLLTEAMTRAFVFADASAAGEVDHVGKLMDSMFARAMSDGEPTEDQFHIARVISDVWLSNLLAWLTRRASATDVSKRLDLAVRLLIGDGEHPKI